MNFEKSPAQSPFISIGNKSLKLVSSRYSRKLTILSKAILSIIANYHCRNTSLHDIQSASAVF